MTADIEKISSMIIIPLNSHINSSCFRNQDRIWPDVYRYENLPDRAEDRSASSKAHNGHEGLVQHRTSCGSEQRPT